MTPIEHSKKVIRLVSQKSNRAILFYSGGKDSIALLDLMAAEFEEVVCVFMYFVKDLEHINRFIRFSESKYKNVKVVQIPHWNLSQIHSMGMYCVPQKMRLLTFATTIQAMKLKLGIDYAFIGEKKSDSMARRIKLRQYEEEAISSTNNIYPLTNWKEKDVLRYIENRRLPKPISYGKKKNRSVGLGFDAIVFAWLRENYPEDLNKILKEYPLSERILFDYDRKN